MPLGHSATISSITVFVVLCVVGSFLLNKTNELIIQSINRFVNNE